ncbi:ATP-binding protein [Amycolatopsis lexingtonensis]|uniref:ATP-binding protein n=1 Tax=Amycolatopsis lexingtonensis TaxID=218822 RepID=UPI003F703575
MVWQPVRVGRDHLGQFTNRSAVDAITELVWNGLDAEADEVDVVVETETMGPENLRYVTRVTVRDNGHGMNHERALSAFESLGDSWKKGLRGRTVNGKSLTSENSVGDPLTASEVGKAS